jgi:CheY-like chemotaxis protein
VRRRVIFPNVSREPSTRQPHVVDPTTTTIKPNPPPPCPINNCKPTMFDLKADSKARGSLDALLALSPLCDQGVRVEIKNRVPTAADPLSSLAQQPRIEDVPRPTAPTTRLTLHIPELAKEQKGGEEATANSMSLRRRVMCGKQQHLIRFQDSPQSKKKPPSNNNGKKRKPLGSILKSKARFSPEKIIPSIPSNDNTCSAPSLVSLEDDDDSSQSSVEIVLPALPQKMGIIRRSVSEPSPRRTINFDPRIWVREFERSQEESETAWYTDQDMERFKLHALALIMARQNTELIATGTGRTVQRSSSAMPKAFYTHAALTLDGEDDAQENLVKDIYRKAILEQEIRQVLLVDPHDICLTLFSKALKTLLPRVSISTARSSEDAMRHIASGKRFDIILIEERLRLFHSHAVAPNPKNGSDAMGRCVSGSALLRTLSQSVLTRNALFIGVSAHLDKDKTKLESSGADYVWSKPPPLMDQNLRNLILRKLLIKRGMGATTVEIFGESSFPSSC